jgi:hypothetical protein
MASGRSEGNESADHTHEKWGVMMANSDWQTERQVLPQDTAPYGDEVERLLGHGTIRHDGQVVGETDYDLVVTPPQLRGAGVTFEAGLPSSEPKTSPEISGRLIGPFFHAQPFAESTHTLVLDDGREFDFHVVQPDTNEIIGVSWFRSAVH